VKTIEMTKTRVMRDQDGGTIEPGRYVWQGPHTDPVFDFRDCRDLVIEGVDVVVESPCSSVFWMRRTRTGPGVVPNTNHVFRDVRIFGNRKAWVGVHVGGLDENGEHVLAERVSVYGCTAAAFLFTGQQSKEHLLTHVRIESCEAGIVADSGFQLIGGCIAVARVGVRLNRVGDPVTITGTGFEACGRLMETSGPATDAQPITLTGVRYAADQLHEDGAMILLRHAGPLTLIGGTYGDGAQRVPQIECCGIGEQSVTTIGVKRGAYGSDAVPFVRSMPGVRLSLDERGTTCERAQGADEHTSIRSSAA
jgi:hypothetical protein